ncbi:olfactory receptor 52E8-like [Engystomops pustulosus]|uniref:olfactory receptor 52E8-like n=1 Tax=Engystomops pustulosus TaxID=76066 RepID=UPI003AFA5DA4
MENGSSMDITLELLGLLEMESHRFLYGILSLLLYITIISLSSFIVYLILTEESLHKPMYLLICNLLCNGIFGSSSFLPKLLVDLLTSSKTISRNGCLVQSLSVSFFAFCEMCTLTIMAYDQYLAVCHPLQYVTLMTNKKAAYLLTTSQVIYFILILVAILLTERVPLCGTEIKNIFCDNMSIFILACTDTSANNVYGGVMTTASFLFSTIFIMFSYVRIYLICLKLSPESSIKTMNTLVTHLINFSAFLVGVIFIFVRYRVGIINLPISGHVLLSTPTLVLPPLLSPLVFGVRTKTLKVKMIHRLKELKKWRYL